MQRKKKALPATGRAFLAGTNSRTRLDVLILFFFRRELHLAPAQLTGQDRTRDHAFLREVRDALFKRWDLFIELLNIDAIESSGLVAENDNALTENLNITTHDGSAQSGSALLFGTSPNNAVLQSGDERLVVSHDTQFTFGAGNHERVKKAFKLLFAAGVGFSLVGTGAVLLFPQVFIRLFSDNVQVIEIGVYAARIYMFGFLIMGAQMACQQTFLALGQAKISLLMACLRKLILLIPLIFILPVFLQDDVTAVFLAEPVSDVLAALVTGILFFSKLPSILKKGPSGQGGV